MADKLLDTKGLNCPMPILKTKKAMQDLPKGGTREVLTTDPGAPGDFHAFCETTQNTLIEESETGGVFRFVIQHTAP